ncbi:MAG: methyltransferase domain-containing protein [Tissierellales bacterium]|nr:methyltransferase domain-containing protein [Tissierellales bacterium]MBN2828242.1 methyltransferase domain-containing protein [Tissierellales bacterium]
MKNLLISGEIGIGKSYMLKNLLEELEMSIGGYTSGNDYDADGHHVFIKSLNDFHQKKNVAYIFSGKDIFSATISKEVFDEFGTDLVAYSIENREITVLDEIGIIEKDAEAFKKQIVKAFDSEKLVMGVVKNRKNEFLSSLKNRKDTKTLFLTGNNGQEIYQEAIQFLKNNRARFKSKKAHHWKQNRINMYEKALEYHSAQYPKNFLDRIYAACGDMADKTWLDIGAGTGAFSLELAKKCRKITCVDSSYNMLLNLSSKASRKNIDNFEAFAIPFSSFEGQQYDFVLSSFSGNALGIKENLDKFIDFAKEKAFIVSPFNESQHNFKGDVLEGRLGRNIKSFAKDGNAMMDYLSKRNLKFKADEIKYDFPQVFNSMEECFWFFKEFYHIEKHEEEILKAFIEENLVETERYYVFENLKSALLIEIKK